MENSSGASSSNTECVVKNRWIVLLKDPYVQPQTVVYDDTKGILYTSNIKGAVIGTVRKEPLPRRPDEPPVEEEEVEEEATKSPARRAPAVAEPIETIPLADPQEPGPEEEEGQRRHACFLCIPRAIAIFRFMRALRRNEF